MKYASIEGRYGLVPTETTQQQQQQPAGGKKETLLAPIIRLLNRKPAGFVDDFFAGVRTVLIGMHNQLRGVIVSSEKLLSEEVDRWAKTAAAAYGPDFQGGGAGDAQQDNESGNDEPQPQKRGPGRPRKYPLPRQLTNLEKWNISRAKDDKIETTQDRRIIYYIERITSLRETLQSVNRLLGPKVLIDVSVTRQGAPLRPEYAKQTFATFVEEQPLFADGLEKWWDPVQNTGLYLLYEYDYDAARARADKTVSLVINDAQNRDVASLTLAKIREARTEWLASLQSSLIKLNNLTGLGVVKDQIGGIIQTLLVSAVEARSQFFNTAIMGEPGTGKTEVARILPAIFYRLGYAPRPYPDFDQIPITTKPDWIAPYEGQSAGQAKLTMLRAIGRVGVIDEAYSLVTDDADGFGRESLSQIVSDLDEFRGLVMIVVLGYKEETEEMFRANPGMSRRFPYRIEIPLYSSAELYTILMNRMEATGIDVPNALRRSTDMLDLFDEMNRRGVFDGVNAAAMSTIVGLYRTAFAIERFDTLGAPGREGERLRVTEMVAEERLLLTAIQNYARAAGFRVVELPNTPTLPKPPVRFAPLPSSGRETPVATAEDPDEETTPFQSRAVLVAGVKEAASAEFRRRRAVAVARASGGNGGTRPGGRFSGPSGGGGVSGGFSGGGSSTPN